MSKYPKINKSDFTFLPCGHGMYEVIYQSPVTNYQWRAKINNMPLIDSIRSVDQPKIKDLEYLKWYCKHYHWH